MLMIFLACYTKVEKESNTISGYWLYNYSWLCSDSLIFYDDPSISYSVKIQNDSDSILVFNSYWSKFYFLKEKGDSVIQVDYEHQARVNYAEIAPKSKGTLFLWQKIPRKEYKCDISFLEELKTKNYIYHKKKEMDKQDSLFYLKNKRTDSLKNKQKIVPNDFIIGKIDSYRFYEIGELPSDVEPPDSIYLIPLIED